MGFFMSDINFCNTKEQLNHLGEVVTGKADGSPTGADIDTSTLPYTGQVRKTLPALEGEYEQSITNKEAEADAVIDSYRLLNKGVYTPGITLESKFEFITYNGESYFAANPPYTTTATTPDNDTGNLFIGGYGTKAELEYDIKQVYTSIGGGEPFRGDDGLYVKVGDTIPSGVDSLVFEDKIVKIYPASSGGVISDIDTYRCLLGATETTLGSRIDLSSVYSNLNSKGCVYNSEKIAVSSIQSGRGYVDSDTTRRRTSINFIGDSTFWGVGTNGGVSDENTYKLSVVSKMREMIGNSIGEGFVPPNDGRIIYSGTSNLTPDSWANLGYTAPVGAVAGIRGHKSNYLSLIAKGGLADATIEIQIDGISIGNRTVTLADTGLQEIAIDWSDGLRDSSFVRFEVISGTVEIQGYFFRSSDFSAVNVKPVQVNRFARGGAVAGDMVTTQSLKMYGDFITGGVGGKAVPLSVINLTANDYNQQTPLATYKAQMQQLINTCNSGGSGCTLLVAGLIRGVDLAIPQREYDSILYELSDENENTAVLDINLYQNIIGGYDFLQTKDFYYDLIHLTSEGYAAMAAWMYEAIKHLIPKCTRWYGARKLVQKDGFSNEEITDNNYVYLTEIKCNYGATIETIQLSVKSSTSNQGNLRVALYRDDGNTLFRVWYDEILQYNQGEKVVSFTPDFTTASDRYLLGVSFGLDQTIKGDLDEFSSSTIKILSTAPGAVPTSLDRSLNSPSATPKTLITINNN